MDPGVSLTLQLTVFGIIYDLTTYQDLIFLRVLLRFWMHAK